MCRFHWIGRAWPRITLTLCLLLGWSAGPWVWSATSSPQTAPAGAAEVAQVRKLFDALAESERQAPSDRFDPAAVVKITGIDPTAIFNWVRDRTDWAPYQGALRGPVGVLMDRIGSSLDRALLLADLLERAGHESRLAHANLAEADARQLLSKVRPMARSVGSSAEAQDQKQSEALIQKFSLDGTELHARGAGAAAEGDRVAEDAISRATEALPAVLAAVGNPGAPDAAMNDGNGTAAVTAMADHWWVQVSQAGQWLDLDPLLPDAIPGRTATAATAAPFIDPARLDAAQWHQVTLRVVIEQAQGGKLSRQTVFTHDLVPAQFHGQRIILRQIPLNWPGQTPTDIAAWKKTLAGQTEWMPQLEVNDQKFSAASFDEEGRINLHPSPNPLGRAVVRVAEAFDSALENGDKPPAATLSAEWIEYEVRRPGAPPRTIRREVFDRLGPAARASGAPAPAMPWTDSQRVAVAGRMFDEIEIVPQVCKLAPRFVSHVMASATLANRSIILELLGHRPGEQDAGKLSALSPLPGPAFALALHRDLLDGDTAGDIYHDSINILTYHRFLQFDGDTAKICTGFDIVCNDVAVRPGAAGALKARVARGVMETSLEASLAGAVGDAGMTVANAARGYVRDLGEGQPWLTVRRADDDAWRRAALPADAKARIDEDLKAGYVVIVPARAPADGKVAWWSVDPKTGVTLGFAGPGWGTAMGEYATILTQVSSEILCFLQYKSAAGKALCMIVAGGGAGAVVMGGALLKDVLIYIILTIFGHIANHYG